MNNSPEKKWAETIQAYKAEIDPTPKEGQNEQTRSASLNSRASAIVH